ncbi:MAG: FIST signal transduction protein [Lachnospiraceae bacterium]
MQYQIGVSRKKDARQGVEEATAGMHSPKLILFFSGVEQFEAYSQCIHEKFPDSISMGMTEIVAFHNGGADRDTLKVVGIESGITCSADVLEEIDRYPIKYVERVKKCADAVENKNSICLEFTSANLCAEESVLATLNTILLERKIPVFGGTSGNNGAEAQAFVSLNGRVMDKSCVFVLIHNEGGKIHLYRENIYRPENKTVLVATKVDVEKRVVYEYNHMPAVKAYAQQLGVSESQLSAHLDTNPVGRQIGHDFYITANCACEKDGSISYYARIHNGAHVFVLEPGDYRAIAQETMQKIKQEVPHPSFAIMCHCLARTLLYEQSGFLQEYAKEMGEVLGSYIGFSGYGEQMGEQNFNQTMIVAVFE